VAVAHTQQDQTETMLMRWLAGAGLRGLCGMEPCRVLPGAGQSAGSMVLLRPLLTTTRAEIDTLLRQAALVIAPLPVQDPPMPTAANQRSRLRHDILPLLRGEQAAPRRTPRAARRPAA